MSGPLPAWLGPFTHPASRVYGWAVARRNARFDRGVGITTIRLPVISIGNMTMGGTGKTPMAVWMARMLMEQGVVPVIAMRGYRAKPGQFSDEEAEYRDLLPNVPVLANSDRIDALRGFIPSHPEVKCVLLDDGFQHRHLHRDLDLVLIDASADTFSDGLLPAGYLREPLHNLRRATGVIVTRTSSASESQIADFKSHLERHHPRPPLAWTSHGWKDLSLFNRELPPERQSLEWLQDKRVLTLLGIGNPAAMVRQIESHGAIVSVNVPCRDHERFDRAKLNAAKGLCDGLDAMVVTGKDWVKLRSMPAIRDWPVPVVVPRLEMEFIEGEEALRALILGTIRGEPVHPVDAR